MEEVEVVYYFAIQEEVANYFTCQEVKVFKVEVEANSFNLEVIEFQ